MRITTLLFLMLSKTAFGIDYSYCENNWGGFMGPAPYKIKNDGFIEYDRKTYSYEKKPNLEKISLRNDIELDSDVLKTNYLINRDEKNNINKISLTYTTEKAIIDDINRKIDMEKLNYEAAVDVKIVGDKCVPVRTITSVEQGSSKRRALVFEPQLCNEVLKMEKAESTANSRLSKLKNCHNEYIAEVKKIINSHTERNKDFYQIDESGAINQQNHANYQDYSQDFLAPKTVLTIDEVITDPDSKDSSKLDMLRVICKSQSRYASKLFQEDQLFEESIANEEVPQGEEKASLPR